jgi:hypothetical protein
MLSQSEQTMDDLLADPLTLALMRADGVDPAALRADLVDVAQQLGERPAVTLPPFRGLHEPDLTRLLGDCIQASLARAATALSSPR